MDERRVVVYLHRSFACKASNSREFSLLIKDPKAPKQKIMFTIFVLFFRSSKYSMDVLFKK